MAYSKNIFVRTISFFFYIVTFLLVLCCLRTLILLHFQIKPPKPCQVDEAEGFIQVNNESWFHFKKSITFKTVSTEPGNYNREELLKFQKYLLESYLHIFQSSFVSYEVINDLSLLIHVRGLNKKLMPYMLAAHLDVVPVIQDQWSYDGFVATETDNGTMLYGRGTIDNKVSVIGMLEALSFLIKRGVQPQRSFFLAFGHDEEVSGFDGAVHIAQTLRNREIKELFFVFDEGVPVIKNLLRGLDTPIAGIGVTEKGSLFLNLTVQLEGGHSSLPTKQSSIGVLSTAIAKLEANPHRFIFDEVTESFIESLSYHVSFPLNVVMSNLWLFKHFLAPAFATGPTSALCRTTTSVTMFQAGVKSNVIPPTAWAIVNHRIHPKQTIDEIIRENKKIINDERVVVTALPHGFNPHPISPHDASKNTPFNIIKKTSQQIFPDTITVPITMVANTDTKHYLSFTKHIFRHMPFVVDAKTDLPRIHGRDERLSKSNFQSAINFYYHLMLNADEDLPPDDPHTHVSEL